MSDLIVPNPTIPSTPVQAPCTPQHVAYCFDVLLAHFGKDGSTLPPPPSFTNGDDSYALFVTWNVGSGSGKRLRGCIGNFSPQPLAEGLREYALISALEDHRFSPITYSEVRTLSCAVSLLTPFTPVPSPLDWILGTHGIHITFTPPTSSSLLSSSSRNHHHRPLSATYLPEVAPEQGWSKEEAVISLIRKAGFKGKVKVGDELWNGIQMKVYESIKSGMTYEEYVKQCKKN